MEQIIVTAMKNTTRLVLCVVMSSTKTRSWLESKAE